VAVRLGGELRRLSIFLRLNEPPCAFAAGLRAKRMPALTVRQNFLTENNAMHSPG
jgi:hypothetical protein